MGSALTPPPCHADRLFSWIDHSIRAQHDRTEALVGAREVERAR